MLPNLSILHWLIVGVVLVVLGYPIARILNRAGLSPWWTVLAMLPYLNVIALWIFAFVRWPTVDKPNAGT